MCPGKASLALIRLHKHVQYLTRVQFPPYINMGGDLCEFPPTKTFQVFIKSNESIPVSEGKLPLIKTFLMPVEIRVPKINE